MSLVRSSLCLDVCFSFVELKRGISQDLISSPKLDKYKIARQLTDKAIKVNALWGSGGGVLLRTEIRFGIWRVSSLPLTPPPAHVRRPRSPGPRVEASASYFTFQLYF